jgi:hypothetical protein
LGDGEPTTERIAFLGSRASRFEAHISKAFGSSRRLELSGPLLAHQLIGARHLIMFGTMRELWVQGTQESKHQAAEIAKDAAPYIPPRLASIDQTIKEDRPFAVLLEQCSNAEEW